MATDHAKEVIVSLMQAVCNHSRAIDALEHHLHTVPSSLNDNQRASRSAVLTIAISLVSAERDRAIEAVRLAFEAAE